MDIKHCISNTINACGFCKAQDADEGVSHDMVYTYSFHAGRLTMMIWIGNDVVAHMD